MVHVFDPSVGKAQTCRSLWLPDQPGPHGDTATAGKLASEKTEDIWLFGRLQLSFGEMDV